MQGNYAQSAIIGTAPPRPLAIWGLAIPLTLNPASEVCSHKSHNCTPGGSTRVRFSALPVPRALAPVAALRAEVDAALVAEVMRRLGAAAADEADADAADEGAPLRFTPADDPAADAAAFRDPAGAMARDGHTGRMPYARSAGGQDPHLAPQWRHQSAMPPPTPPRMPLCAPTNAP